MSTTYRMIVSVLALSAFLGGLFWGVAQRPAPVPAAPPVASETVAWTDEDWPIRVTNTPEGKRAEIAGYADITCEGCTDDQALFLAQDEMSNKIMRSLTIGKPLHVGEGDVPAYVPAILLDMGWVGRSGDGCECLYPPLHAPIAS